MKLLKLGFLLFILWFSGCGKEEQPDIPYVYVNEILYPNSMDYIPVSGYLYVEAGYRGIVVYRQNLEEFSVFERCCPYDPENPHARIIVNPDNLTATDTCCHSTYELFYGNPTGNGPSSFSLLKYQYSFDGERLYISN
jgi:hypothetical protein